MKATRHLRTLDQSFWLRNTRDLLSNGTQKRYLVLILALVILAGYTVKSQSNTQSNNSYNGLDLVDKNGIIRKPADYRDRYQALGVFSVVDYNNDTEMHYTYA